MRTSRGMFLGRVSVVLLFAASFYARSEAAPAGSPVTIRGKITNVTGDVMSVTAAGGEPRIQLPASAVIRSEISIQLSDIMPGMYLGTTAEKQPDGTFLASEVHVFSEDQHGTGEGHRPSSSVPNSTMTNADVEKVEESVVRNVKGRTMVLQYHGGEVSVFVPPEIPLVKRVAGSRDLLKRGAAVTIRGTQATDGTISAAEITVRAGG